ncbi:hypothetical protein BHE74_00057809, partial [Ensete ventricosum]
LSYRLRGNELHNHHRQVQGSSVPCQPTSAVQLSRNWHSTVFSYINLYGKYPPGLFASECREGKEGLACPATPPTESEGGNPSAGFTTQTLALLSSRFCILETGKMSCFLDVAVVPLFLLVSVILWNGSDVSAYLKPGRCHVS